ncbi:hypothetical protein BGY98DRAFT_1099681 [Russula aff. rugulosa BPL654]|nr:hypothetical protein BGY98DRAFT_1099681 [Russula aff. rugulosa BPL654]
MVAISSPPKVLVTGANGYLATWVVKKYLEAGYCVRGSVRSLSKSAFLNDKFAHYKDRFELVVVEDITKDGAFDEAVKGVDAIAHTAFPFQYMATNPEDPTTPAVRGTTSILNSALKHGSALKRLVLTSSAMTAREHTTVPCTFSESNWNEAAVELVKTKASAAGPFVVYSASKTLAEKAAWEFVATHKSEISWDLVTINPPWIFGEDFFLPNPSLGPAPTVDDINVSQREIYDTLSGAKTMISALQGAAGGHRIIVRSGPFFYQDILDAAAELGIQNVPRGEPGSTEGVSFVVNFETKKAEELLGLTQVTPLKDMVADSVKDFKARGYPGFT